MKILSTLRNQTITRQLSILNALVSLTITSIAILGVFAYSKFETIEQQTDHSAIVASVLSQQLHDDPKNAKPLQLLTLSPNIISACIYTGVETIAKYPNSSIHCPVQETKSSTLRALFNTELALNYPLTNQPQPSYLVLKSSLNNSVFTLSTTALMGLFGLLCLVYTVIKWASWTTKQLLQPLATLAKTVHSIASAESYSIRVDRTNNNEINDLIDSFNLILDAIEQDDHKLKESEEQFKLISSSSKVGIFRFNANGDCDFVNAEMSHITGLSETQLLQVDWSTLLKKDDLLAIRKQIKDLIENNRPISINCELNTTPTKWVNGHLGLLRDNKNSMQGFLGTVSDVTEIQQAQSQLEHMAFYDTLTGLANRRLFRRRLEHVISNLNREGHSIGLIIIDLDHFKNINDTLGHDAGDKLLVIIAERIQQQVRASDTVARLGGDEFAIILPAINDSPNIAKVAEKIIDAINIPINFNENELSISASIGIAIAPNDATEAEELIKQADMALYRAKDQGRNNAQFFTSDMNIKLVSHLDLVRDLRSALTNDEFFLVFQPQIDLKTNQLTGFEALVRWNSPIRGMVPPDDFINTAEDTALIIPIGRVVIEQACKQLHELQNKQLIDDHVAVTVNISARQFQDRDLVEYIQSQLKKYHLHPHQFEIELTESVLMENISDALVTLKKMQQLGILISIDDFGTGYSSLGYLKQLPVNILKVDRSFITDIPANNDDMEITAAVIAMAHKLNYKVVAEGVETDAQLQFLVDCQCDYGQGYLFSKPLSRKDLLNYCSTLQQQVINTVAC